jgi:hypothetical protein
MVIKSKFDINQTVYLKELKIFGRILSIFINNAKSISYNIRYFSGLDYKEVYFLEDEISDKEEDKRAGF